MILLILFMTAAAVLVVVLFAVGMSIAGVVALVVVGYIDYQSLRHLRAQLQSRVTTTESGIRIEHAGIGTREFAWEDITRAGYAVPRDKRERPVVFIYDEGRDRLITIPDEFENFRGLMAEVRRHTSFEDVVLAPGETIEARLAPKDLDGD
ncbi:MAG: hypothetical protein ACOCYG_05505 [Spirochaetota bacterium]